MTVPPESTAPPRIGAVNYLNSKPLIHGFDRLAGEAGLGDARLLCDLPSRLADSLAVKRLDVALVPVFEALASPDWRIVSDACVASDGPVGSVKVYFRLPPAHIRTLALDEGSRTSAALCRLLLAKRHGVRPLRERLPIGSGLADTAADAVLLIGDRAMHPPAEAFAGEFVAEWDLATEWRRDTGLPFVFAAWAAREGVDTTRVVPLLEACRDAGVAAPEQIAADEAPGLGLSIEHATRYLRENLRFRLGDPERAALDHFQKLGVEAGLLNAPAPAP